MIDRWQAGQLELARHVDSTTGAHEDLRATRRGGPVALLPLCRHTEVAAPESSKNSLSLAARFLQLSDCYSVPVIVDSVWLAALLAVCRDALDFPLLGYLVSPAGLLDGPRPCVRCNSSRNTQALRCYPCFCPCFSCLCLSCRPFLSPPLPFLPPPLPLCSPLPFLPLPSTDRSIGRCSVAATSACARQLSKSIVLTCA